jgi:hypothetical protein
MDARLGWHTMVNLFQYAHICHPHNILPDSVAPAEHDSNLESAVIPLLHEEKSKNPLGGQNRKIQNSSRYVHHFERRDLNGSTANELQIAAHRLNFADGLQAIAPAKLTGFEFLLVYWKCPQNSEQIRTQELWV